MNIGLYFGSFNPIHVGHMAIAQYMIENTEIDQLWFVVSPHNPLKKQDDIAQDDLRLEMVKLATEEFFPKMKVCDIELSMPRPSYTIDTLRELKNKYPENKFAVILGSDSIDSITKWKDYQSLLKENKIYVYPRQGSDLEAIKSTYSVDLITAPILNVSSTSIRESISEGKDVSHFLPEKVLKYIKKNRIY